MQQFIDKLISRLEEAKKTALDKVKLPIPMLIILSKRSLQELVDMCFEESIRIANELAEEYKGKYVSKDDVRQMLDGIVLYGHETSTDYHRKALKGLRELSVEEYKPRTNADRIRSMSDEELVQILVYCAHCTTDIEPCKHRDDDVTCEQCGREWLQSEVKE